MGGLIDNLTGKTSSDAARAAALQRQQQDVANARQLSTAATQSATDGLVRKNARGRRLLADATASDLPTTVA